MLFKLKQKLSLVDDYIFIERAKTYYLTKVFDDAEINTLFDKIAMLCERLERQYNQIFLRLKMMNLSYEILNKQLDQTKEIIFAEKRDDRLAEMQKCTKNLQILRQIQQNMPKNLQKLSLNRCEIKFIMQTV